MHSPVTLGPVVIRVSDLPTTGAFYRDVVGLRLLRAEATWRDYEVDGVPILRLVMADKPGLAGVSLQCTGLFHTAWLMPSRQALSEWYRHFLSLGGPGWEGAGDHDVSEALYLRDPEGNGVEIYADRPEREWPRGEDGRVRMGTSAVDLKNLLAASDRPIKGLPLGTRLGHIHLKVADIEASARFYGEVLGLDIQMRLGSSALFVSAAGYHHHVGLNTWESKNAPPLPGGAPGLSSWELANIGSDEWEGKKGRMEAMHVPFRQEGKVLELTDPSGIYLRLRAALSGKDEINDQAEGQA